MPPTTTQNEIADMMERIDAARADGTDVRGLEAQLDYLEHSATTTELRAEIERDYAAGDRRDDYLSQIDALDERGIHRIERHAAQSPHVAVGDALSRELQRERETEKRENLVEINEQRDRQDVRGTVQGEGLEATSLDRGREARAEPSKASWAKDYDVSQDQETGVVAYARDGQERIRDDGRTVHVATDERSIRDAVALVKEEGDEKIEVRASEPEKRAAIMRECVRQHVKIACPTKEVEGEYHRAIVAVERDRAKTAQAERAAEKHHDHDGPEIGA